MAAILSFGMCGFTNYEATPDDADYDDTVVYDDVSDISEVINYGDLSDYIEGMDEVTYAAFHQPQYRPLANPWDEEVIVGYEEVERWKYRCVNCKYECFYDDMREHITDKGSVNAWIVAHWKESYGKFYRHSDNSGKVWWVNENQEDANYKKNHQVYYLCDDGQYHKKCIWYDEFVSKEKVPIKQIIHHDKELVTKGYYDVSITDTRPGWDINLGKDSTVITTSILTRKPQQDVETQHEYRWLSRKVSEKDGEAVNGSWKEISAWHTSDKFTDSINYTPATGEYDIRSGVYEVKVQIRVKGFANTMVEKSYFITYGNIKGKCQIPNAGGGYLIGIESYDNQNYSYEMLILDCTLLAEGKDAWTYTTGKCPTSGNCLWTVWQPQYGYYWTLFRVFDKNGKMLDQDCYGFINAY